MIHPIEHIRLVWLLLQGRLWNCLNCHRIRLHYFLFLLLIAYHLWLHYRSTLFLLLSELSSPRLLNLRCHELNWLNQRVGYGSHRHIVVNYFPPLKIFHRPDNGLNRSIMDAAVILDFFCKVISSADGAVDEDAWSGGWMFGGGVKGGGRGLRRRLWSGDVGEGGGSRVELAGMFGLGAGWMRIKEFCILDHKLLMIISITTVHHIQNIYTIK